jgi:hypothetical protein
MNQRELITYLPFQDLSELLHLARSNHHGLVSARNQIVIPNDRQGRCGHGNDPHRQRGLSFRANNPGYFTSR